ncbi:TPA: hypothetical protein UMF74_002589 [Stenotrophomonas maltophilia]|nr:hypothetical protein [Stenotrophomonas maltophilia]EKU9958804.1 hypothetical protein [Stenotrophomonas maltophilia]EKU9985260.1 hypothetical protein [Stenotrophomonas maltophilia]ELN2585679.1 hypothetical protein [Stenotrophomonas maltophilia]ELN2594022.1 hypothetical protein [Stenotrophomonas maltophilia]
MSGLECSQRSHEQ